MSIRDLTLPFQGFDDHDGFQLDPQHATMVRNVRSNRSRIVRAPGGTLMAPSPVPDPAGIASAVRAGTLTSPLTTGSVVYSHTLGVAPAGYLFTGATAPATGASTPSFATFVGVSDGTNHGATTHTNKSGSSLSWSGYDNFAIFLIDPNGTVLLKAVVTASTDTTFTLNWTVVDATTSYTIGYTLVGGTGVQANVTEWSIPTSAGNKAVTGTGFQPQVVFHVLGKPTKVIIQGSGVDMSFGAMTTSGQMAATSHVINSALPAAAECAMLTDHVLVGLSGIVGNEPTIVASAKYVSMDPNGFTVNVDNPPGSATFASSLSVIGMAGAKVSSFAKTAASAPVAQAVTGVGFQPDWVLFSTVAHATSGSFVSVTRSHGFTDDTTEFVWAESARENASPGIAKSLEKTSAAIAIVNNAGTELATAIWQSFDSDGFTLNWPLNNSLESLIAYVALNGSVSGGADLGVIRNYAQVYVGATTTVEKLLMLTNKSAFIYTPSTSSTGIWTPTSEAYTGDEHLRFSIVNTQGIAAWSQGVDNIRQWDGASFSALVTSGQDHAAKALIAFADRIVSIRPFFGGIDHQTQIRWPVSGNVNNWNGVGSGALEIIETSQDPLVTGFVLADRAFLAKRREVIELIWTGTDSPVFGTQPRIRGMGVLAPHSVALAEQVAFWLGPDDIYMFDGSTMTAVGDRVYNTIVELIDYNQLDDIQGAVYTPDSLYMLVVPPFLFIYDYRRDIWYQDDVTNFEAIGIFQVGTNFTADIDNSQFPVIGDSAVQTVRLDKQTTSYLGGPIDSWFSTRDYTAEELGKPGFSIAGRAQVTLWDLNSLREIRFQAPAGNLVEVGVSTDRGASWDVKNVTVNAQGVGVAWFQTPFSMLRFRFRDYGTDSYEIRGTWGIDVETAGAQYP